MCKYFHRAKVIDNFVIYSKSHCHSCNFSSEKNNIILEEENVLKNEKLFIQDLKKSILEVNISTDFHIEEQHGVFERCFVAMETWICAFKHSLKTIQIDGTFMKNKQRQVLLAAVGVDRNGNIFPIALGF